MRTATAAIIGSLITAAVAGGGFAYAAMPSATAVISGCYDKKGNLRLIVHDGQTCDDKKETAIEWNQQGQRGAPGATGAQGPAGTGGSAAPTRFYIVSDAIDAAPFPDPLANVQVQRDVPAGDFQVFCRPGDSAVSGALVFTNDYMSNPPNPAMQPGGNVLVSAAIIDETGTPVGYENAYRQTLFTNVSSFFPPTISGSRQTMTLDVTCADQTA